MKLFSKKTKSVVGIDIGTHTIKLVELKGDLASPKVTAWATAPLPVGAFSENAITNSELVADALRKILLESGAKTNTASVSVSSSHAITKVLTMPKGMSELEMEEQISIEALHFIPYPIDEVNIDFEVLGTSKVNPEENDVLLVACRRSIVDDYIDLVEDCDLSLTYVDIDTYALERAYRAQNPVKLAADQIVAIFDIGFHGSHLMVLDAERVLYSRHQNFGASQLVKLIRKEYGVSPEEAEEILHSTQPPGDFITAVQEPFVEMLNQEVGRALQFFYSSSSFSSVDNVVISGGCSAIEGAAADLELKMRTKVTALNPINNAIVQSRRDSIEPVSNSLAIAYGLSLRGLS